MNYMLFLKTYWRFLSFGVLIALFSSFGQTYFIGLFSAEIKESFHLSHGTFGLIYSVCTLGGAVFLVWLGRLIDHIDLRIWVIIISCVAIAACILMGFSSSVYVLAVGLLLLRLSCQSLLTHTYMTSMARYFDSGRGKAISIAMLGHPLGEAIFPIITILLLLVFGWRGAWFFYAAVGGLLIVPLLMWLLRGHTFRHRNYLSNLTNSSSVIQDSVHQWTHHEVLRDIRFYLIQFAMMAPPFIFTGLLIHQAHLVDVKGWSLRWFATSFTVYAAMSVVSSILVGVLIDKIGATKVAPHALIPLFISMLILALFDSQFSTLIFMGCLGLCMGMVFTSFTAIWAELYGVTHLGAIRAIVMATMVFVSALAPAVLGWMFDAGVVLKWISLAFAVWSFLGWGLLHIVLYRWKTKLS